MSEKPEARATGARLSRRSFIRTSALGGAIVSASIAAPVRSTGGADKRRPPIEDPFAAILRECGSELGDVRASD